MTLEELIKARKTWKDIDQDVQDEVTNTIKMCKDASEMSDDNHPKNQQYNDAFGVIVGVLEGILED